ncbi:MAG: hypothetical protein IPP33_13280 [Flavobacteriales bacterium]|nr:hypothetical protein [Flavobacteriales bacterium]
MRALQLAVILVLNGIESRAQRVDSIPSYLQAPAKLIVKLDMRGSFINNESVKFAGVKLGLEHAGKVQYGIGYSFLFSPVERKNSFQVKALLPRVCGIGYVTPYFEYAFYQRGPWELRIPCNLASALEVWCTMM